ncbi:hypothetical protein K490DRAFT_53361 [Neofusicoccum parvum]|uniref:Uncharacterized protein n=1 Tax=Neofusicoccum parvum TaxID=310453 RepID=A0ACB5SJJ7_9PEZI|nr:hypothetical protein K490DRAFT_53361 [Neofusicoccum parvum]
MSQATVTVRIGKSPTKDFLFFKELLCSLSPFFRNAFSGDFNEAKTGIMHIDDVDAQLFGEVFHWIYTRDFTRLEILADGGCNNAWDHGVNLYALADRLDIPKLRIDILTTLHVNSNPCLLDISDIQDVLSKYPKSSTISRYITDLVVPPIPHQCHHDYDLPVSEADIQKAIDGLPRWFLAKVMVCYYMKRHNDLREFVEHERRVHDHSRPTEGNMSGMLLRGKRNLDEIRKMMEKYEAGKENDDDDDSE